MTGNRWTPLVVSSVLAWGVWVLAALNGHGWELLWLPGVMAGAAWPRGLRCRSCDRNVTTAGGVDGP
jgi:hypothetical protein